MTPTVRSVTAASTLAGSRQKVSGSMSAKTGVAPVRATEFAVAAKVNEGTITSSPGPMPLASSPRCRPEVPELTATHGAPEPEVGGELLLERRHLGTLGEHAAAQHSVDGRALLVSDERRAGGMKSVHVVTQLIEERSGCRRSRGIAAGVGTSPSRRSSSCSANARAADPADLSCWHAHHEGVGGYVGVTTEPAATIAQEPMRTGATQTARAPMEAPSAMATPTGSQSSARLAAAVGVDRARVGVIREDYRRADEHAVTERRRLVDESVVLDLAPVADLDPDPI